jgi:hypothetical protein
MRSEHCRYVALEHQNPERAQELHHFPTLGLVVVLSALAIPPSAQDPKRQAELDAAFQRGAALCQAGKYEKTGSFWV